MKNMIGKHWREREYEIAAGEQKFIISEADKVFIRERLVESIIGASELIRYKLLSILCILYIYVISVAMVAIDCICSQTE